MMTLYELTLISATDQETVFLYAPDALQATVRARALLSTEQLRDLLRVEVQRRSAGAGGTWGVRDAG